MGSDMEQDRDKRIDGLLARYGANRARWPDAHPGTGSPAAEAEARAIDSVLSLATSPGLPRGAMDRLMARLDDTAPEQTGSVVLLAPAARRPSRRFIRYAAALPLAASLALGFYLGARGSLDTILPTAITGSVALNDDPVDDLGGVGEAEALAEESTS